MAPQSNSLGEKGARSERNSFSYYCQESSPIKRDKERESERAQAENAGFNASLTMSREFSRETIKLLPNSMIVISITLR